MYANYFCWLETADQYFPYWGYPGQGRWAIYGMVLPDKILEKVYHKDEEKIFAMYRGEQWRCKGRVFPESKQPVCWFL
jgi:hypothetical protein